MQQLKIKLVRLWAHVKQNHVVHLFEVLRNLLYEKMYYHIESN